MGIARSTGSRKGIGGRPPVTTDAVVAKLTEAFKLDIPVEEACLYAGISKDTYYRKVKADPQFSDEMERARMYPAMLAKRTVVRAIEHDPELALKFLERRRKAEYSPRAEISVQEESLADMIRKVEENRKPVKWTDIGGHGVAQKALSQSE